MTRVETIKIRAHHLLHLTRFEFRGAEGFKEDFLRALLFAGLIRPGYLNDLFREGEADGFLDNVVKVLSAWQTAPLESRVVITDEPDKICSLCYVGQHCKEKVSWDLSRDRTTVQRFTNLLKQKPELGQFTGNFRANTFHVKTNMDSVRKFVAHESRIEEMLWLTLRDSRNR